MQTKYAIIILNYYGFHDTCVCIESIRKTIPAHIFLVDNSANLEERQKLEKEFGNSSDVNLLFPKINLGFAAGVNLGLKRAIEEGYNRFLLLNNDAVLLPSSGDILNNAIAENPGSLIAPTIIWGNYINTGNYYNKYLGLISSKPYFNGLGSIYYFTGCALAFDKKFLDAVGFFDESFFFFGEDVEFSHRAQKKMAKLILLPETLVKHEGSKSSKIASFFHEYYLNHTSFMLTSRTIKNPLKLLLAYIGKFFLLGIRAVLRSFRYRSLIPLWAFLIGPLSLQVRPQK